MEAVSFLGSAWFIGGLAGFILIGLFAVGRRRDGFAATGIIALLLLNPLLKFLVDRPRPPAELVGITDTLGGLGFPSGHAYHSLIVFGLLIWLASRFVTRLWLRRSIQVFLVFLILAVGLSRVSLGAHWPSDVLGAYLLGGSFLVLLLRVYQAKAVIAASQ
jgi:undecaprenyl-diphosphatase